MFALTKQRSLSPLGRALLAASLFGGALTAGAVTAPAAHAEPKAPEAPKAGQVDKTDKGGAWVSLGKPQTVTVGDSMTLKGHAGGDGEIAANTPVHLHYKIGDIWTYYQRTTTDGEGAYSFTVRPRSSTTYRTVLPETSRYHRGFSYEVAADVEAKVEPAPTPAGEAEGGPEARNRPERANGSASSNNTPAPAADPAPAPAPSGSRGQDIVNAAAAQAGKPYVFGAAGPNSFDCSGLTLHAYRAVGVSLPHSATKQAARGYHVDKSQAALGDLILFGGNGSYYHVGIYAGNGEIWHAPQPGQSVKKQRIWTQGYTVRRIG